jgi:tetratricopeptide (TPR) repeat protein
MTSSQRQAIKRGLAIGLAAAATLAAVPIGRAESITPAPATLARESSDQPDLDVEALIAEAERLQSQGDYSGAEAIWRQLLDYSEILLDTDDPGIAFILEKLAQLLHAQRRYTAAEPLFRRSLAIREKALGPDHPDVATSSQQPGGSSSGSKVSTPQPSPSYRRSLAIGEKALGPDHPNVATALNNLAVLSQARAVRRSRAPLSPLPGHQEKKPSGPIIPRSPPALITWRSFYGSKDSTPQQNPSIADR